MTVLVTLDACKAISPSEIFALMRTPTRPALAGTWTVRNEIAPSDLFCYLYAKFGPPNGIQNLLRRDDSDNLIHWDWTLSHPKGLLMFLGLHLRTEVQLLGDWDFANCDRQQLLDYMKRDLPVFGKEMARIRRDLLEDWDMLVNPVRMLTDTIELLRADLDALKLDPVADALEDPSGPSGLIPFQARWHATAPHYLRAFGLSLALRALAPVLGEAFINFLLFMLRRPELKANDRLYQAAVRANLDVRAQSLHMHCIGFARPVDWSSPECRRFHSVINDRNDMLHGNVVPEKLKFSEIYFLGRVPVFKEYRNFWQQAIATGIETSGLQRVTSDLEAVQEFMQYVLSCLDDRVRVEVTTFLGRKDFGLNRQANRLGILLPDHVVDFSVSSLAGVPRPTDLPRDNR